MIGIILAYNVFLALNSVKFCNEYIYTDPHTSPLVETSNLFIGAALFTLFAGLLIMFFKKE